MSNSETSQESEESISPDQEHPAHAEGEAVGENSSPTPEILKAAGNLYDNLLAGSVTTEGLQTSEVLKEMKKALQMQKEAITDTNTDCIELWHQTHAKTRCLVSRLLLTCLWKKQI